MTFFKASAFYWIKTTDLNMSSVRNRVSAQPSCFLAGWLAGMCSLLRYKQKQYRSFAGVGQQASLFWQVCMFTISSAVRIQLSELCCPEKRLGEIAVVSVTCCPQDFAIFLNLITRSLCLELVLRSYLVDNIKSTLSSSLYPISGIYFSNYIGRWLYAFVFKAFCYLSPPY